MPCSRTGHELCPRWPRACRTGHLQHRLRPQTPLQDSNPKYQDVSLQKFRQADISATTLSSAWRPWKTRSGQRAAFDMAGVTLGPRTPPSPSTDEDVQLPHDWKEEKPHPDSKSRTLIHCRSPAWDRPSTASLRMFRTAWLIPRAAGSVWFSARLMAFRCSDSDTYNLEILGDSLPSQADMLIRGITPRESFSAACGQSFPTCPSRAGNREHPISVSSCLMTEVTALPEPPVAEDQPAAGAGHVGQKSTAEKGKASAAFRGRQSDFK